MPLSSGNHTPSGRALATIALTLALTATAAYVIMRESTPQDEPPVGLEDNPGAAAVTAFHVGTAALDADDIEHAVDKLDAATRLAPEEPAAWANLALARMRQGDYEAASRPLAEAIRLAPDNARIATYAAALASRRGDEAGALAHLKRAVAIDPGDLRARYGVFKVLAQRAAAPQEAEDHLDHLLRERSANLVLLLDHAEVLVRVQAGEPDAGALARTLDALTRRVPLHAAQARKLLDAVGEAVTGPDPSTAATPLAFLRNVLKPTTDYRQDLAALQETFADVAEPLRRPRVLHANAARAAPPDGAMTFAIQSLEGADPGPPQALSAVWPDTTGKAMVLAAAQGLLTRHNRPAARHEFPGQADGSLRDAIRAVDVDNDLRTDLCLTGTLGLRVFVQDSGGDFTDATARLGLDATTLGRSYRSCWALDLESDGDMDLVLASPGETLTVLSNGGNGRFTPAETLLPARDVTQLAWADLDADGNLDLALLDGDDALVVLRNERAGRFALREPPSGLDRLAALATGDIDGDGRVELIAMTREGSLLRIADRDEGAGWTVVPLPGANDAAGFNATGHVGLWTADMDNNGALDVVASGADRSRVWLADGHGAFTSMSDDLGIRVASVLDLDEDGRLELVGIDKRGKVVVAHSRSTAGYHWQGLRLTANPDAGDQRINAFAIGGEVEIRSATLAQKRTVDGPRVHFGLGRHRAVDVARVVWPNGTVQTAYELAADTSVTAAQRLKGSCPFLFAHDGDSMRFVTDFLWRSPLGLRINAQTTANVVQTEDRVRIDGSQLRARNGRYELRITAELWETHFFDHVSLLVVDHPPGTEALVDERFAIPPPDLSVRLVDEPVPLDSVHDESGRSVAEQVRAADGHYVDTFALGHYQGVTDEHWIEFELGAQVPDDSDLVLVAHGWTYPTDSSINLALGQGDHPRPHGLALEVDDGHGGWKVAIADLGFPAGKRKTMIVPLGLQFVPGAPRRARLRTNLEVYWDAIGWARARPEAPIREQQVGASRAELRFRGYSRMASAGRRSPDLPQYRPLAGSAQRWRDLVGFHTRFGDVRELLARTDDRYVIMNAGDELVLEFPEPAAPIPGWERDYVLIGDGWVKDGDFNTVFSRTVRPLPRHDDPAYSEPLGELRNDPAFQRHRRDWQHFHTRFVTPDGFRRGLHRLP